MKKVSSISFIVLLLLSMATVVIATPWDGVPDDINPAQSIWVDPENTSCLDMGDTFTVDILVNITSPTAPGGGTGLYGFEYKLAWNDTVIQAIEMQTHTDNNPGGDLLSGWTSVYVASNVTGYRGDGLAYHGYAVSATGGVAFTGVDSLCTYTFQLLWQPSGPGSVDYLGVLDIYEDILVDDTATPITHTTVDGEYCARAIPVPTPKVGIDPVYVMGVYGETFTIDIVIESSHPLFAEWDMCGWEAKLSYNTTVLDALGYINGTFMAGFEGVNGTYPICNINDTAGVIHMAELFLGDHTQPYGFGVLMTIIFNATSMYTVPPGIPPHLYPLDLFDVLLVDCASQPIDLYGVNDGEYEEPYKILGWALDCWTDPLRKLNLGNTYETPFTGEGLSDPGENGEWDIINDYPGTGDWVNVGDDIIWTADAYEPQEFVKLYAYLSYNEYPEQNKIITFEIHGPCNQYDNITIFRTAITNATGVATINFTIPHPCTELEDKVFGKWVCWQSAQVKDPWEPDRYRKVEDVLLWDVGWKVELLEVAVVEPVWPCAELEITIWYKNIAQVPMWVVFTYTIFDTLLDPIGELVTGDWVPAGEYCHPYYDNLTVWIHIPKWAHVGPFASVYVNAFTALPMQCGLPYCPEVSVLFTISLPP
jgi:hypothetical protein